MKKMAYIAAVSSLAVLLSACAGLGSQTGSGSQTLIDDLGPGGLAAVKKEVKALLDDSGPGGLMQQATQNALNQPADPEKPDGPTLLQMALGEMAGEGEPAFVREEVFRFNWEASEEKIRGEVDDKLRGIFSKAQTDAENRGSPNFEIKASVINANGKRGKIFTAKDLKDMPRTPYGVVYTAVNLAGMTSADKRAIVKIAEFDIPAIPDQSATPLRMDEGPIRVVIPKSNTRNYVLATGRGAPYPSCLGQTNYTVVSDKDTANRQVTLYIWDGKMVRKVIGSEYTDPKQGGVVRSIFEDEGTPQQKVVGYELVRKDPKKGWAEIEGHEGQEKWFRKSLGSLSEAEKALKQLDISSGDCIFDTAETTKHFVLAALEAKSDPRPTVVHYYVIDLVSGIPSQSYEYTKGRPACPPSEWGKAARKALFGPLVALVEQDEIKKLVKKDASEELGRACGLEPPKP